MKSSTKFLFHYTPEFENLLGIIEKGFKYCEFEEDLPFTMSKHSFFSKFNDTDLIRYFQPVVRVCFCDIPFDSIEDHKNQYGSYCIGMSKDWGMNNGITPVRYIHKYSPDIQNERYIKLTQNLELYKEYDYNMIHLIADYLKEKDSDFNDSLYRKWYEECPEEAKKIFKCFNSEFFDVIEYLSFSMGFLRSHSGPWEDRVSKETTERNFYNEREWRALKPSDSQDYLTFEFNDIKKIILLTDEERIIVTSRIEEKFKTAKKRDIEKIILLHQEMTPEIMERM